MKKHIETIIHSVDRHPHFQKKNSCEKSSPPHLKQQLANGLCRAVSCAAQCSWWFYINLYHLRPSLFMYMNLWRFTEGSWGVDQVGEGWWKRSGQWWNSWITCKKNGNSTKGSCTDHFSLGNAAGVLDLGLVKQGLRPVLLGGAREIQPYPIHKMVEVNPIQFIGCYSRRILSYPIISYPTCPFLPIFPNHPIYPTYPIYPTLSYPIYPTLSFSIPSYPICADLSYPILS